MRTQNSNKVLQKFGRHSCFDSELPTRLTRARRVVMQISRLVLAHVSMESWIELQTLVHWRHGLRRDASSLTATDPSYYPAGSNRSESSTVFKTGQFRPDHAGR